MKMNSNSYKLNKLKLIKLKKLKINKLNKLILIYQKVKIILPFKAKRIIFKPIKKLMFLNLLINH